MKKIVVFLSFLAVCWYGCSNNPSEPVSNASGGLSLKINKVNAPSNVVLISAELIRSGYQTLTGSLNFLSDTTASIIFSSVQVGVWHLNVTAKDSADIVVYQGETDINVLPGMVTQVSLTLLPTGNGTGSIQINVNWGTQPPTQWIDYSYNPVFSRVLTGVNLIRYPVVLREGSNSYKMWYANIYNSGVANIGYAVSENGLNWQSGITAPVLYPGTTWDSHFITPGAVIKINNIYYLYYSGSDSNYDVKIGLATSSDGIYWTKLPNPVLSSIVGESSVSVNSVVNISGLYYMYYTSIKTTNVTVCLAISADGINWQRYENNPILQATTLWERNGVYNPAVIKDGNIYKMVYMNYSSTTNSFGLATSTDGLIWQKDSNNPFFDPSKTHSNWASNVQYPCLIKNDNSLYLYYTGILAGSSEEKIGIVRR